MAEGEPTFRGGTFDKFGEAINNNRGVIAFPAELDHPLLGGIFVAGTRVRLAANDACVGPVQLIAVPNADVAGTVARPRRSLGSRSEQRSRTRARWVNFVTQNSLKKFRGRYACCDR